MCAIHLVESPKKVLGRAVDIIATRVIWEVVAQWGAGELLPEQVDLVQEQNDTRPHEPSRIDDRVEENQAFHHSVLRHCQLRCKR